ncbi:MAG TPA: hypothetical protein VNG33_04310 [Polyangiaceae bacterium]|nr:hypothetical protein [Polyangiaceae bacterium]
MRALSSLAFVACACATSGPPLGAAAPTNPAPASPAAAAASSTPTAAATSPVVVAASPPQVCDATPREIGRIRDPELNEVSGVVESRKDPRVLFVHNDSGDSPRFFAIDRAGQVLAELVLESVPLMLDAEEIAIGQGPDGAQFIYLGDTGNNFASFGQGIPRRKAVLYRIAEPDVSPGWRAQKVAIREAFPIVFTFPNGARDVEALFIDPQSGDLTMISKQPDGHSQILSASAAMLAAGGGELTLAGELRFGQAPLPGSTMPTAGSISRDGSAILVRTYSSVFLFSRRPGESVPNALRRAPVSEPSPQEAQGEAISFVDADSAYVTISEGVRPPIHCAALRP